MTNSFRNLSLKSVKQMTDSVKYPPIHNSLSSVDTIKIDTKLSTTRLCPINRAPEGQSVYDTIVFYIFCPKDKNIAVCNTFHTNGGKAVWLPFIYLSNDVSPKIAIVDSLSLILSDGDPKHSRASFDAKVCFTSKVILPKTNKSVTQINCMARLHSNTPGFKCCRQTSRIIWMNMDVICKSSDDLFWGPHIHEFCIQLKRYASSFRQFHRVMIGQKSGQTKLFCQEYSLDTIEHYFLYSMGITRKQIDLLFIDFFEHCFPSTSMSFLSFADYLCKYGFVENNLEIHRLFNAFDRNNYEDNFHPSNFLTFEELLLGLTYIDRDIPYHPGRLTFVFRYYDQNRDGFLSEVELRELVTDIHKNEGQEEIERIVSEGMTDNESPNGMNWEEFFNRTKTDEFGDPWDLCKYDTNLLRIIYEDIKTKTTRPMDTIKKICLNFFKVFGN